MSDALERGPTKSKPSTPLDRLDRSLAEFSERFGLEARALDALVAEKVMGFRPMYDMLAAYPRHYTDPTIPEHHQETPRYTTDIAAAWLVVEKLRADGWTLEFTNQDRPALAFFWQKYDRAGGFARSAETAAEAICRAALAAVGAA